MWITASNHAEIYVCICAQLEENRDKMEILSIILLIDIHLAASLTQVLVRCVEEKVAFIRHKWKNKCWAQSDVINKRRMTRCISITRKRQMFKRKFEYQITLFLESKLVCLEKNHHHSPIYKTSWKGFKRWWIKSFNII